MTHAEMTALDVMGAEPVDAIAACVAGLREWPNTLTECVRGYSETPCTCGQHWDLIRGRCLACWAGIDPSAEGLWRSVAGENAVDDRDHIAAARAEEMEEREREEEEWHAQMIGEIEPEVFPCPF